MDFTAHITRREEIERMRLLVLDNLFSDQAIASTYAFLRNLAYRLEDVTSPETAHVHHLKAELPPPLVQSSAVMQRCVSAARELLVGHDVRLDRVYVNMILHGDLQGPHRDPPGGMTALYYANPVWEESWLGETVFYDAHREPLHAVGAKPGRLALFHSDILHRAGVPSRECYEPRVSVVFLFVPSRAV